MALKNVRILIAIFGGKRSTFRIFNFEGAENISAIFFSPSNDIDKFNRMGLKDGFNERKYKIKRTVKLPNTHSWEIESIIKIVPTKNTPRLGTKV